MKYHLIFVFLTVFFFASLFVSGQNWVPVGTGISVDSSKEDVETPVKVLCVYDNKLYIGGVFKDLHRKYLKNIACWNGKKIDTVGSGIDGEVCALLPANKYLYIGGRFDKRTPNGMASGIVEWKDTLDVFSSMNKAFDFHKGYIYSIYVYQNEIYAAGGFSYRKAVCVAKWNGTSWDSVGQIMPFENMAGLFGCITTLTEFNGKLYAGGLFHINNSHDTYCIAYWDGKEWQGTGKTAPSNNLPDMQYCPDPMGRSINTMMVYKGYLYVGGDFDTIDGKHIERFAKWDGTTWSAVGNFSKVINIQAMTIYNNKLYIGGIFDSINGSSFKNIACWDGKSSARVGDGLEFQSSNKYFKGRVKTLAVYNNELYAGGIFNLSGKNHLNNLAKWKGY